MHTSTKTGRARIHAVVAALTLVVTGFGLALLPSSVSATLPGSNFNTDDGNLRVDGAENDWAGVASPPERRKADEPTGTADDSFGQGTSEDSPVPTVVNGSIPPNKSDLLNFAIYLEETNSGDFLHMFWHRVQEPTGTTNMDFEFNKSKTISSNGVTPVRSAGDVLIQYDLSQGGTHPTLWLSRWLTSGSDKCEASKKKPCWGVKEDLTSAGDATGSINTDAIPAAESDGLGDVSARTFGEATVDFSRLGGGDTCTSFGSVYLKSRSSDSFNSELKDFIAPEPTGFDRCGAIKIHKTRKHAADGTGNHPHAGVTFTISGGGLTSNISGTTDSNGDLCVDNLANGTYTVTETVPTGYTGEGPKNVTVDNSAACSDDPYGGETVSFSNTPRTDLTVAVDSQVPGGTGSSIDCTLSGSSVGSLTTTPAGTGQGDGTLSLTNLLPGTYNCTVVIDP